MPTYIASNPPPPLPTTYIGEKGQHVLQYTCRSTKLKTFHMIQHAIVVCYPPDHVATIYQKQTPTNCVRLRGSSTWTAGRVYTPWQNVMDAPSL